MRPPRMTPERAVQEAHYGGVVGDLNPIGGLKREDFLAYQKHQGTPEAVGRLGSSFEWTRKPETNPRGEFGGKVFFRMGHARPENIINFWGTEGELRSLLGLLQSYVPCGCCSPAFRGDDGVELNLVSTEGGREMRAVSPCEDALRNPGVPSGKPA